MSDLANMVEIGYNYSGTNRINSRSAASTASGLSNRNGASVTMGKRTPSPAILKPCAICGTEFSTTNANYKYCSPPCRAIAYPAIKAVASRQWAEHHAERRREIQRASRQRHLEQRRAYGRGKMREWRDANPELSRASLKASYEKHAEERREYQKQYRINNSQRTNAQQAVKHAVKRGDLPAVGSSLCVRCSNPAAEYHHWSYERENWLKVEAMCPKCHKAADQERAKAEAQ